MAIEGVIITTTINKVTIDFNDLAAAIGIPVVFYKRSLMEIIEVKSDHVAAMSSSNPQKWEFSINENKSFIKVKSVNGVVPTTLRQLGEILSDEFENEVDIETLSTSIASKIADNNPALAQLIAEAINP